MRKVFIGPLPKPVTGQSNAFAAAVEIARPGDYVLYAMGEGGSAAAKIGRFLQSLLRCIAIVARQTKVTVYITTSRSLSGFARDASFVLLFALLSRAKVVAHVHGSDFEKFRDRQWRLVRAAIDFVYSRIHSTIVLNEGMAKQFSRYKGMKLIVVENCVDRQIHRNRSKEKSYGGRIEILFIGNIIESKGFVELIIAVERLSACKPGQVGLTIAGAELDRKLIDIARERIGTEYELPEYIRYVGAIDLDKKIELLRDAHIFALPSYYVSEGVPIAALEAMNFGCCLVLSDWMYLPAAFANAGCEFPVAGDDESLYLALRRLVSSAEIRSESGARNFALSENRYTMESFQSSLRDVLDH